MFLDLIFKYGLVTGTRRAMGSDSVSGLRFNSFVFRSNGLSGCLFSNNCYSFCGDRGPAFRCCRGSRLNDMEVIIGRGNAVRRIGRCCRLRKCVRAYRVVTGAGETDASTEDSAAYVN